MVKRRLREPQWLVKVEALLDEEVRRNPTGRVALGRKFLKRYGRHPTSKELEQFRKEEVPETKKMWVDPNEGWKYGFPKLYDPDTDGDMQEWIYANGYPRDKKIHYTRMWYDSEEDVDES